MEELSDWTHRREHIESRADRKGATETNILTERAATDAENHQGGPGKIRGQRRAGAATPAVLSVRLTAEQLAELTARAESAGQPTSAYARNILLEALGAGERDALAAKLEAVLRHTLTPEVLTRAS